MTPQVTKLVVLDDDPTGTQTVHGINVLTQWEVGDLEAEFRTSEPAFYILTNSRSLPESEAVALNREVAQNLATAWRRTVDREERGARPGSGFRIASRSDSTLRGHFPAETDVLQAVMADNLGRRYDALILVPFFLEGGRFTIDDVHYVQEGERLVPVGDTEFARDPAFGFRSSDLKAWVAEKTRGRIRADRVGSISLSLLRDGTAQDVAQRLLAMDTPVVVINAETYEDMERFVAGLQRAEAAGRSYLFRTAASFVRVYAGIPARELLASREMLPVEAGGWKRHGGLLVVGSYVRKTTEQLEQLLAEGNTQAYELSVEEVLAGDERRDKAVQAVVERVEATLARGINAVMYTSRELKQRPGEEGLQIGTQVSRAVTDAVRALRTPPRFIIAKGGITSSDVATRGLGIRRARVLGQILPGVPVWRPGPEARFPGIPYVVFPGNVGDREALARAVKRLT